ncbi:hypothetical protein HKCCE3408_12935 [Rhodobacterales bacterium HKCCE3408]|nr:hypothetical protein [Rhodobacterales bacterium HKCCE3408]
MIDWDRVAELKDEIGEDGFAEVGGLFITEIEARLDDMASGTPVAADFHFLRGSAANLGLATMAEACAAAEAAAKAGGAPDLEPIAGLFAASRVELGGLFESG